MQHLSILPHSALGCSFHGAWSTKRPAQTSWLSLFGMLHRFEKSWCFCRPYLLPCLVVAIFGLATGAFCVVYMPETLPEAQVQRSSQLLPKWLQPRSDYQALMSDEAESPLMGVKQRRPPRPSEHT